MNHHQDYMRNQNPLQNYYTNNVSDPKSNQIKKYNIFYIRVKSSENLNIKMEQTQKVASKKTFIEPGTSIDSFEEILSTTVVN
jgi:hypothetical protein